MDSNSFPLAIAKARLALSIAGDGLEPRRTRPDGFTWHSIDDDISLIYRNVDLYIRGFRIKNFAYRFSNAENFTIAGGTVKALSFTDDYKGMGWDRISPITITLDNITNALDNVRYSKASKEPTKSSMLRVAIGFAEAIRFDVVITKIREAVPILPSDVSWDPGSGTRVLRHGQ